MPSSPNSLVTVPDPQRAWAYRPAQPLSGEPGGPLSGLSFSVKDLFGVPGWPLRASTQARVTDPGVSPLVQRLLGLGAQAVGKTHLHEIALGITGANGYGGTLHPRDAARVPGGSSSGAAVSVALNQVDFALGTDTGGSIRVPAAWCGVIGYKPTKDHPAWPTTGVLPLSPTCDHAGPLTGSVACLWQIQAALSGQPIIPAGWKGLRVGLWQPAGWTSPEVQEALAAFSAGLERQGAVVREVDFPEVLDAYSPIVLSEAARVHEAALEEPAPGFLPFTLNALRQGAALRGDAVAEARARREVYRVRLADLFAENDVLIAPSVPTPPPLVGQDEVELGGEPMPLRRAVLRLTAPFSLLGVPAVSWPFGGDVGVQIITPWGTDHWLLGLLAPLES